MGHGLDAAMARPQLWAARAPACHSSGLPQLELAAAKGSCCFGLAQPLTTPADPSSNPVRHQMWCGQRRSDRENAEYRVAALI